MPLCPRCALPSPGGLVCGRCLSESPAYDATRAALATFDRDRLVGLGAHPYLVFMAQVRLSMEREPGNFEYF